jgi:hypothetical protein
MCGLGGKGIIDAGRIMHDDIRLLAVVNLDREVRVAKFACRAPDAIFPAGCNDLAAPKFEDLSRAICHADAAGLAPLPRMTWLKYFFSLIDFSLP